MTCFLNFGAISIPVLPKKLNCCPKFPGSNHNKQIRTEFLLALLEHQWEIEFNFDFVNKNKLNKNLSFSREKINNFFSHIFVKSRNVSVAEMSENHHVDGVRFYDLPWNFFFSLFLTGNKTINKKIFFWKKKIRQIKG